MKKKQLKKRKNNSLIAIIIIAFFIILARITFVLFYEDKNLQRNNEQNIKPAALYNTHVSQDLKISFKYPQEWSITDKNYSILLTNYKHNFNSNYRPKKNEIEIQMSDYFLCQPTLDQDIVFWGCGEGNQVANTILEKTTKQLTSGTLFKYIILYPQTNTKQTLYYLQNKNKFLQISKEPELSEFDKEFNEIVNSINFLQ